jgi:hypothetical protein
MISSTVKLATDSCLEYVKTEGEQSSLVAKETADLAEVEKLSPILGGVHFLVIGSSVQRVVVSAFVCKEYCYFVSANDVAIDLTTQFARQS